MITVRELVESLSSDKIDQDAVLLASNRPYGDVFEVEGFYALTSKQGHDEAGFVILEGSEE